MPQFLSSVDSEFDEQFRRFLALKRDVDADVDAVVSDILADVEERGDAAVLELTRKFDRIDLVASEMRISAAEIDGAAAQVSPDELEALSLAASRIREYHTRQLPEDAQWVDQTGATLGWRWSAVDAAGLYVPGGLASYPSSVLMNAIPASVAGVERLVMVVPTPNGVLNPLVLAAAKLAGVDEIYRIGGAQAVGALAYGTKTIAPVDKITGPGNAFVAAAKRRVFGRVGIDMIAGPSEVLVIADADNNPDWIAVDLLSQAEHDESAQSILVTDNAEFGQAVSDAVAQRLATLERAAIAEPSWRTFGAVITVRNLDEAAEISNRIAPEHLELCVADPETLSGKIKHAGAVFLGAWTPEAVGDYIGGPNHVLPTARSARFSSGLSVLDFLKRTTLAKMSPASLAAIGGAAETLAISEGLQAHGLSLRLRLDQINEKS